MLRREVWRNFDLWLFGAVVILCVFGVAMVRSAIAGSPGLAGLDQRQAIFAGAGIVVLLIVAAIDYRYWAALSRLMYIGAMLALIGIYVAGEAAFGSARWFETSFFSIQPSELVKIVMILVLADYFSRSRDSEHNLRWIITSFLLTAGIVVWIVLQPNLSTSIVLFVIWFSMLWVSGLPTRYLLIFGGVGIVAIVLLFPRLEPYQQQRVFDFLFADPDARHGNTYNVEQALISIGSGGWFGMGYGHGTQVQLHFLKVRHTDFIFSAMAEEFGFVGTMIVVSLLIFVIVRCLNIARTAPDTYGALIAYGFAFLIFFQMAVNIGVNLRVIPVTGLTLPFVSYGGSSLLSLIIGIGLVESVAARRNLLEIR